LNESQIKAGDIQSFISSFAYKFNEIDKDDLRTGNFIVENLFFNISTEIDEILNKSTVWNSNCFGSIINIGSNFARYLNQYTKDYCSLRELYQNLESDSKKYENFDLVWKLQNL